MKRLKERLGLPAAHYRLHQDILEGLPVALLARLASELEIPKELLAKWLPGDVGGETMSVAASEAFYRLAGIVDALLELYDEDKSGIVRWLSTPKTVLADEMPIHLLTTEAGGHAVLQLVRALEHGLPV